MVGTNLPFFDGFNAFGRISSPTSTVSSMLSLSFELFEVAVEFSVFSKQRKKL